MYYVGIDLGGTVIKIGLVHEGRIVERCDFRAQAASGLAAHLEEMCDTINRLLDKGNVPPRGLGGIGLSSIGIVDVEHRRVLSTNDKYDDAPNVDIEKWASDNWGVPLFIDNDARMATVGEWQYGAGKGYDNVVMMTLGTGIGSSVIMEGRIVRGKHYQAGCLGGHFVVDINGPKCNCGGIGCVEAIASSWSLPSLAKAADGFENSLLAKAAKIDFKELFAAAAKGDAVALRLRDNCMKAWSVCALNLIHAYDPEIIVVGGGVMNSKDVILPYMREYTGRHSWTPWGKVRIEASTLMNDAAILGVCYCLEQDIIVKLPR